MENSAPPFSSVIFRTLSWNTSCFAQIMARYETWCIAANVGFREDAPSQKPREYRRIELAIPDSAVSVLADPEALRRVISNLLSNAVKYTPPEKKILLSARREGREAVLRVVDEGAGIPRDALPHVFDRFYRAESSRASEGSRLGLAIVRETVDALEERIEVDSVPGDGSAFIVFLPLCEKISEKERLSEKN
jgi:signal transduction histidine kinase